MPPEVVTEIDRALDDPNSLVSQISAEYAGVTRMMFDPEGPLMGPTKVESRVAARRVLQRFAAVGEKELGSENPDISRMTNACKHVRSALGFLGIAVPPEDPMSDREQLLRSAEQLVALAKEHSASKLDPAFAQFLEELGIPPHLDALLSDEMPTLSVADEATTKLIAKQGKVAWALTELEVALPPEAAQKVRALKHRVAEELGAIVREVGTYVEIRGTPDRLPSNADIGLPPTIRGLATADFYAEKLNMPVEEVQRLYRDERDNFLRLLDQHGLRMTVKAEDL